MDKFEVIRNKKNGTKYEIGKLIEGVIFSDGTVVIHWLSDISSISIFKNFDEFDKIHGDQGHPEYNTKIQLIKSDKNEI